MAATTDVTKIATDIRPFISKVSVSIGTDSDALSVAYDLQANAPVGFMMPSAWTAANLTFQGSFDNSDFGNVYDAAGGELTVTADTDIYIAVDPIDFIGIQYIKVRSGTAATPVAQGAARTVGMMVRRVA